MAKNLIKPLLEKYMEEDKVIQDQREALDKEIGECDSIMRESVEKNDLESYEKAEIKKKFLKERLVKIVDEPDTSKHRLIEVHQAWLKMNDESINIYGKYKKEAKETADKFDEIHKAYMGEISPLVAGCHQAYEFFDGEYDRNVLVSNSIDQMAKLIKTSMEYINLK